MRNNKTLAGTMAHDFIDQMDSFEAWWKDIGSNISPSVFPNNERFAKYVAGLAYNDGKLHRFMRIKLDPKQWPERKGGNRWSMTNMVPRSAKSSFWRF